MTHQYPSYTVVQTPIYILLLRRKWSKEDDLEVSKVGMQHNTLCYNTGILGEVAVRHSGARADKITGVLSYFTGISA
jgi:hypothetical protein